VWAALAVATLFGGCAGLYVLGAKPRAATSSAETSDFEKLPAVTVTPHELIAAYKTNKAAADKAYKGKKIAISGLIEAVEPGFGGETSVRLKGADVFHSVNARDLPKDDVATLQKGAVVKMVCKGDGAITGSPMLQDCRLQ